MGFVSLEPVTYEWRVKNWFGTSEVEDLIKALIASITPVGVEMDVTIV